MSKQDLSVQLELQSLKKENVSLKNKLNRSKSLEDELREKIKNIEINPSNSNEKVNLSDIKLHSNIRDNYEYEEIEILANDILKNGQLQSILISNDNFLIAGYRRYTAIKYLNDNKELFIGNIPEHIIVNRLELELKDLSEDKVIEIQLSENEQRRSLDNFQLSKLYNEYIKKGFDQKYLCEKFSKSKTFVSAILSLKKIDPKLQNWVKEFQVYGVSKKKFTSVNSEEYSNFEKGIIGWKPLYDISKQDNLKEQKKIFLKYFKSRLLEEELNYFKDIKKEKINTSFEKAVKQIKSFGNIVNSFEISKKVDKEYIEKIKSNISEIESLLTKMNK